LANADRELIGLDPVTKAEHVFSKGRVHESAATKRLLLANWKATEGLSAMPDAAAVKQAIAN
jgi:hypothetical protein